MAPEVYKEQEYDEKIDIWSVGVLSYLLLTGETPFNGRTQDDIGFEVCNNEVNYDRIDQVSEQAKQFIKACLKKSASDRPSIKELLMMDWQ